MMKDNSLIVSIIMNCHNGQQYLKYSLKSIFNQTYKNWELIFWDNLSTDGSKKILDQFRDKRAWRFINKKWELINPIYDEKHSSLNKNFIKKINEKNYYKKTPLLEIEDENNDYILMGRTYLDKFNFKAEEG